MKGFFAFETNTDHHKNDSFSSPNQGKWIDLACTELIYLHICYAPNRCFKFICRLNKSTFDIIFNGFSFDTRIKKQ
ncbi:hypothetical protein B9Z55_019688 [Caenorhabditis nigoni]|uniref:C-type lectin domain-containing protein n=1 Tax=Caenorhabditis nigoni TaxID=1611254 RepID=A0A2G5TJK1_9PELO|nr:hypothetical protein B9Z55_019688 [Caenorhabditis nigoni]